MAITRIGGANAITGTIPQGNIANASLGAVTALPAGVGGKVLQVVQGTKSSERNMSSTSYTTSQTTVSITPSSTSSKILITYGSDYLIEDANTYFIHTLYRDSTNVVTAAGLGQIRAVTGGGYSFPLFGQYLDSPSSTSAISYTTYYKRGGGSGALYINWNNSTSVIIAREIGA